jgi:hypothetical protein
MTESSALDGNNDDLVSEMSRKAKNLKDKFKNSLPFDIYKRREFFTSEKRNTMQTENDNNNNNENGNKNINESEGKKIK